MLSVSFVAIFQKCFKQYFQKCHLIDKLFRSKSTIFLRGLDSRPLRKVGGSFGQNRLQRLSAGDASR